MNVEEQPAQHEHAPNSLEKKEELKRKFKRMAMAVALFLGGATAIDASGIGTRRINIRDEYTQSLRGAEDRYQRYAQELKEEGPDAVPPSSRSDYFHNIEMLPTPEEVAAVERLMEEYDRPIRIYSGTRLFTRLFEVMFGTAERSGHYRPEGLFFDVHGIYLKREDGSHGERPTLSHEDLQVIVAELAHAFQSEQGRLSLPRIMGDLSGMIMRGERYGDLYDRPGTYEREAHLYIQRMLENQVTLYQSERHIRTYFPEFLRQVGVGVEGDLSGPITQENFPYERYEQLIRKINSIVNTPSLQRSEERRAAEAILAFLELLQGFSAENRRDDEAVPTLIISPNIEHYQAIMEVLGLVERSETPITERRTIPPPETPQDALTEWREAVLAARRFNEIYGPAFAVSLSDAGILPEGRQFTQDTYRVLMERLLEAYPLIRNTPSTLSDSDAALRTLTELVNGVCYFDRQCTGRYGILERTEDTERNTMPSYQAEAVTGDEHFQALRRFFIRHQENRTPRSLIEER